MTRLKNVTVTQNQEGSTTTAKTFNVKADNSEEFFMAFVKAMAPLVQFKSSGTDILVLVALCCAMSFEKNVVYLTKKTRNEICEQSGISASNLSRSLRRLEEAGLISGDDGNYIVNPLFFWKGTTDARNQVLREKGLEFKIRFGGPNGGE